jgi:hypothetical protein
MVTRKSILMFLLAGLVTVTFRIEARLESAEIASTCSLGQANALFQEFVIPILVWRPRGIDHPKLVDSLAGCQYRLFRDGTTVTFTEDDWFVGGITYLGDYEQLGRPLAEVIADLEANQDRVWLRRSGGIDSWVEQPLERTAYKTMDSLEFGSVVFQQRAFIRRLPPGEYESYWEHRWMDRVDATATVRVIITAAEK